MRRANIYRWIAIPAICVMVSGCSLFGGDNNINNDHTDTFQPIEGNDDNDASQPNGSNQNEGNVTAIQFSDQIVKHGVIYPGAEITLPIIGVHANSSTTELDANEIRFETDQPEWLTIDDSGTLSVAAHTPIGLTATITATAYDKTVSTQLTVKYSLEDTLLPTFNNGIQVIANHESTAVIVNKERSLPDGYTPGDLTEPQVPFSFDDWDEKRQLRQEAADALESLFTQAKDDGMTLRAVSGYRSYARQNYLFNMYVERDGEERARMFSAVPGTSEHQTGLAMDVSTPSIGNALQQTFGDTKEGKWLAENAHKHGFIIRYPKGKEDVTGYAYEPWHIRYVGETIAADIYEQGITLEEYFGDAVPVTGN